MDEMTIEKLIPVYESDAARLQEDIRKLRAQAIEADRQANLCEGALQTIRQVIEQLRCMADIQGVPDAQGNDAARLPAEGAEQEQPVSGPAAGDDD